MPLGSAAKMLLFKSIWSLWLPRLAPTFSIAISVQLHAQTTGILDHHRWHNCPITSFWLFLTHFDFFYSCWLFLTHSVSFSLFLTLLDSFWHIRRFSKYFPWTRAEIKTPTLVKIQSKKAIKAIMSTWYESHNWGWSCSIDVHNQNELWFLECFFCPFTRMAYGEDRAKQASLFNPFIQCWLLSSSISLNREACHTRGDLEVR